MTFATTAPVGKYIEVNGEWVHVFYLPELSGAETMVIRTGGVESRLVKVGTEWVHAAALVDSNGDLVDSTLITPPANWQTYDGGVAIGASAPTSNRVYLARIDEISATTTTMTHYVGAAAGNCMVGLYTFDGATFTRVATSASTAIAGTTTTQNIALSAAYTRQPGLDHYAAFIGDAAAATNATIGRASGSGAVNLKGYQAVHHDPGSFTLPATIAVGSVSGQGMKIWQFGE